MTPEDVLQDLRDIQLPDAPDSGLGTGFAPEPFLVLAALLLGIAALRWVRRTRWRRQARRRLRQIAREPDTSARWSAMIELLRRLAPICGTGKLPDIVFLPPERIGEPEAAALREHLRRRLEG